MEVFTSAHHDDRLAYFESTSCPNRDSPGKYSPYRGENSKFQTPESEKRNA